MSMVRSVLGFRGSVMHKTEHVNVMRSEAIAENAISMASTIYMICVSTARGNMKETWLAFSAWLVGTGADRVVGRLIHRISFLFVVLRIAHCAVCTCPTVCSAYAQCCSVCGACVGPLSRVRGTQNHPLVRSVWVLMWACFLFLLNARMILE